MNIIARLKDWVDSMHASNPGTDVHTLMQDTIAAFEQVKLRLKIVEITLGMRSAEPSPEAQSPAATSAPVPEMPDPLWSGSSAMRTFVGERLWPGLAPDLAEGQPIDPAATDNSAPAS